MSDAFAGDPAASHVSSRPVNCYVASEAAFERAAAWLVECHSDHSSCRRYTSNFLPNRVIDVSIPNESHIVRLVSTAPNELENPAKYIALSYCWGIDQPIKTTKSTLFQHMFQYICLGTSENTPTCHISHAPSWYPLSLG